MSYRIIIPARYNASRLPGKPLAKLAGRPMLEWVWLAARASAAEQVVIATDDERIELAARSFGAEVVMTSSEHRSGSERIAECARKLGWPETQIVVNLQGDEPLMPPACLDQVATLLAAHPAGIASLCWPIRDADELADPNAVKVVCGADGRALYFSRSPIPAGERVIARGLACRHLGLYAYRNAELQQLAELPASPLEETERLEQLRWLAWGRAIRMARAVTEIPPGVDSPEDLARVEAILTKLNQ